MKQLSSEVVVGAQCGNAVLRGAHVFLPGILASPKCKTQRHTLLKQLKHIILSYFFINQHHGAFALLIVVIWLVSFFVLRHEGRRCGVCLLGPGGEVHPRSPELPGKESVCGKWSRSNGPLQHLLHRWTCQVSRLCYFFINIWLKNLNIWSVCSPGWHGVLVLTS